MSSAVLFSGSVQPSTNTYWLLHTILNIMSLTCTMHDNPGFILKHHSWRKPQNYFNYLSFSSGLIMTTSFYDCVAWEGPGDEAKLPCTASSGGPDLCTGRGRSGPPDDYAQPRYFLLKYRDFFTWNVGERPAKYRDFFTWNVGERPASLHGLSSCRVHNCLLSLSIRCGYGCYLAAWSWGWWYVPSTSGRTHGEDFAAPGPSGQLRMALPSKSPVTQSQHRGLSLLHAFKEPSRNFLTSSSPALRAPPPTQLSRSVVARRYASYSFKVNYVQLVAITIDWRI